MIKFFTIGLLFFLLYRLIFPPVKSIQSNNQNNDDQEENIIDIDYEDVE